MKADRETHRRSDRPRDHQRRRPDRQDRARRSVEPPSRTRRAPRANGGEGREKRPAGSGPHTTPIRRQVRPTSTTQAKARAKARKAKAPKAVRAPLRERLAERLIAGLASIDLRPHALAAKVPFVVLVIGSLGIGLGATLWLSTDSAERSYALGNAREANRALSQQKEALERDVLAAQSAPALAESARNLGMIPSRDTAHLVQDPSGNWIVVGKPKPAEGAPPPPLNTPLPEPTPPPPPVNRTEMLVRIPSPGTALAAPGAPGAVGGPGAPAAPGASPAPGVSAAPGASPAPAAAGATPPDPAVSEVVVRVPAPVPAAADAAAPPPAAPAPAPAAPDAPDAPAPPPAAPAPVPPDAPPTAGPPT
jgi:hypothetical protein